MKFNYELKIGDKSFFIEDEAATMKEFVKQVAPLQALEVETQGKTGVYFSHRKTQADDEYFALYHAETNTELNLGIRKDNSGILFPGKYDKGNKRTDKAWRKVLHDGNHHGDEMNEDSPSKSTAQPTVSEQPTKQPNETEERLTVQLRELMDAAGIENAGQEKSKVMKLLGLKVGLLLKELNYHQKLDLYGILFDEAKLKSGKAAGHTG